MSIAASSITVAQALELLDRDHPGFAEGMADGKYMFWIGSGISLGVVPGLDGVVEKVLVYLQGRMTSGDATDPFRSALTEIVQDVAGLSDDEEARFDVDAPVADWPDRKAIIKRLKQNYALMLNVSVKGQQDLDHLLWYGVDPAVTYGSGLDPDVEHVCLAILGLEGVATVMASANWDGLIEMAMAQITDNPADHLGVVVLQQDIRDKVVPVQLLKFHGCAVKAGSGGDEYRRALVGRQRQITSWGTDPEKQAVRAKMLSTAIERRTFMVGFSGQDDNIQHVFDEVRSKVPWPWPSDPPALVFAEDRLGQWQKNLLEVTYGEDSYGSDRAAILDTSLIRAFGKPLLTALVLDVLTRKAHALIRSTNGLDASDADALCEGATVVRDSAAAVAGTGTRDFVTKFVAATARTVSFFSDGLEPASTSTYGRLTMQPASQVATAPAADSDGVRELAVSLALLGRGVASTRWSIDIAPTAGGTDGVLRVKVPGGAERAVFLTRSGRAAVELSRRGPLAAGASDAIVVRCDDSAEALPRSPSAPPGRSGSSAGAEVMVRQLLRDSSDLDALHRAFCLQAGLPA